MLATAQPSGRLGARPSLRGAAVRGVGLVARAPRVVQRQRGLACTAALREIPLFPLSIVALPNAQVPLHIFEARYRILFNTLLKGDKDVDTELVDDSSVFAGSKRFGMCYVNGQGGLATVGSVLEIHSHEKLPDGRMLVVSKGAERFRINRIVKDKPYIIAEVEDFPDEEDKPAGDDAPLISVGDEVKQLFLDTLRLSTKSRNVPYEEPEDINGLSPSELSFWVPTVFREAHLEQQNILEMNTARARLYRERDILRETLKYLSATVALKSALSDIDSTKEGSKE